MVSKELRHPGSGQLEFNVFPRTTAWPTDPAIDDFNDEQLTAAIRSPGPLLNPPIAVKRVSTTELKISRLGH